MNDRIRELLRQRDEKQKATQALLDIPKTQKRALTEDELKQAEDLVAEVSSITREIEVQEKLHRSDSTVASLIEARTQAKLDAPETAAVVSTDAKERAQQEKDAFRRWMISGEAGLSEEDRAILKPLKGYLTDAQGRAQGVGTGSAGGYTVPQGFYPQLVEALKQFGAMFNVATIWETDSGNDVPIATVNDTAQVGELLAENVAAANQDATFAQIIAKAYKYSSKLIPVSIELLQDSAFDLDSFLPKILGERIGRIANQHFTTGTGTGQPQGVVPAAAAGKVGTTGQTTTIIYDDFVDLYAALDPAYDPGAGFMMNKASLGKVLKIKDTQGWPIFQMDPRIAPTGSILAKPVTINQDMASMAANAKSVLYGDYSKYLIRRVRQVLMLRLVERFAELGQVGFLGFSRMDGRLLDAGTNPVKYYQNSAT